MRVSEIMTSDVKIATPQQPIEEAARMMADIDAGFLPVGDHNQLVGTISDRDITVRAVAAGMNPETPVGQIMTQDVKYCFADENVEHVAKNMGAIKVRRLPVLNRSKRLVGIVSLGDIALADGPEYVGASLCDISEPGGAHSQADDGHAKRTA